MCAAHYLFRICSAEETHDSSRISSGRDRSTRRCADAPPAPYLPRVTCRSDCFRRIGADESGEFCARCHRFDVCTRGCSIMRTVSGVRIRLPRSGYRDTREQVLRAPRHHRMRLPISAQVKSVVSIASSSFTFGRCHSRRRQTRMLRPEKLLVQI
jgi:hypothetical protein